MNEYSQPEFYRFNQDSLDLVRWVAEKNLAAKRLLDLGAGCGVVAIEYHLRRNVDQLTLVEVQAEYLPHLLLNTQGLPAEILIAPFSQFRPVQSFDLVLSNPPYFLKGHGQDSKDERRNIARSFQRDSWRDLLECVERSLEDTGTCFMALRSDPVVDQEIASALEGLGLGLIVHPQKNKLVFLELFRLNVERT